MSLFSALKQREIIDMAAPCQNQAWLLGPLPWTQRVNDLQEAKAVKIGIAGHDAGDAVLAHQRRGMQVMHEVAARLRQFVEALAQHGRVTASRGQDGEAGRGQQRLDEAPGRGVRPRAAVYARVRADAQELVADPPGQEPGRSLAAGLLDQLSAGRVVLAVRIGRIQQHVRIDDEHGRRSVSLHPVFQRVSIGHVDVRAAAMPLRQRSFDWDTVRKAEQELGVIQRLQSFQTEAYRLERIAVRNVLVELEDTP